MDWVPDLGKEWVNLGTCSIIPASSFAFVAPMAILKDKARSGEETVSERTFEFGLGGLEDSLPISYTGLTKDYVFNFMVRGSLQ